MPRATHSAWPSARTVLTTKYKDVHPKFADKICRCSLQVCFICAFMICELWWRHEMETFSALLAFCAGNSPVPGEFPTQRPVTWNIDIFFDLHLNKQLSKQLSWRWFEMPSCPLWHHCNGKVATAFLWPHFFCITVDVINIDFFCITVDVINIVYVDSWFLVIARWGQFTGNLNVLMLHFTDEMLLWHVQLHGLKWKGFQADCFYHLWK